MICIRRIHFENEKKHENITKYRCFNSENNNRYDATRNEMIAFIEDGTYKVFVEDKKGGGKVEVCIVYDNPPYLRTKKNGIPTDNLLELPTF